MIFKRLRELLKKCSFNLDFVQNRSEPPPLPPSQNFGSFGIFWDTFPKVKTFKTFGTLLCILIHPIFWQKVSQNFLIWSTPPPPFLPKISKKLVFKKCPKNFWFASEPTLPPFWTKSKLKLHFFRSPLTCKVLMQTGTEWCLPLHCTGLN